MTQDELSKPLVPKAAKAARRAPRLGGVAALALASCGALGVAAAWALFVTDPLGGEPVATAAIERRTAAPPTQTAAAPEPEDPQPKSRDGVPIVRPGEPMPKTGPVIIRVPGAGDDAHGAGAPAAKGAGEVQTAMLEESRHGQLPRIAVDGRRPLDAYARPVRATGPRVALVVAGLGVGREATAEALKTSPEVTLAFSPYGSGVADFVEEARKAGHEVLIQAPMEPFAYPSNDPGPQTLLTSLPAPANLDRLRWALGRAQGYVGVAPLSGAKFLQSDDALAPVFTEIARRGLMFLGQAGPESRFGAVAERSGLAFARAGSPIDAIPDAAAIDAALAALERDAKAGETAVGWAGSSPLTLKRVEAWRTGLGARGVTLVPVTAALKSPGPS